MGEGGSYLWAPAQTLSEFFQAILSKLFQITKKGANFLSKKSLPIISANVKLSFKAVMIRINFFPLKC